MPTDVSTKTRFFTESVIREMTRLAMEFDAVNLAQGFPDFPAPAELKEAAKRAINEEYNQYAITHGSPNFRKAIAQKARSYNNRDRRSRPQHDGHLRCDRGDVATLFAVNPGDEMIVFEPFYENYGVDTLMSGATARYVALREPGFPFDAAHSRMRSGPDQGDHHHDAAQSHRQGFRPDGARADRRPVPPPQHDGGHG